MPPFDYFIKVHLEKKDGECSPNLTLVALMLAYENWSGTSIESTTTFFTMLKKRLGPPIQGDETSPPGKIMWRGWRLISAIVPSHPGIKGEEKSVLALAHQRGFDGCPICMQLVIGKSIVTECGHKFCSPCIQTLKENALTLHTFQCPLCRNLTKQTISSFLIYRDIKQFNCPGKHCAFTDMDLVEFEEHIWFHCNSRKIQCECGELILALNWTAHEKNLHPPRQCQCGKDIYMKRKHTCKYANIVCEKCEKVVTQKDLPRHLQTSCSWAAECKCCGLPGTIDDIKKHQAECRVENCQSCDEIFRADKLGPHQRLCPKRDFECVVEGCTEKMPFDALITHFVTVHPVLIDTGIYCKQKNSLYLVMDTKSLPCIGKKIDETEEDVKFRYIGWNIRYDEWIPKSSPRVRSLKNNIDHLLSSRPWTIFPKIFVNGGLGALIKNNLLSHNDVELLCRLEQNYKEHISTQSEDSEEEKNTV